MSWIYKKSCVMNHDDLHPDCTDFVYQITYTNGQKYIGKKAVRSIRKKPPLKGKKRNRRVLTNLPFKDYEGSHGIEGLEIETKEILYQCSSRKASTFIEAALLFSYALFKDEFLNEDILGKFHAKDAEGIINATT